jgi:hypothetical protein
MIITAVVAASDGLGLTVAKAYSILLDMYGEYLGEYGARLEVFDVDDLFVTQSGIPRLYIGGQELSVKDRVFLLSNISMCSQRERRLNNLYHTLLESGHPLLNRSFLGTSELEVNKRAMHAMASSLGIRCVPTMEFVSTLPVEELLQCAFRLGLRFPMIFKPNRLMMGAGIMLCETEADFSVKAGIIRNVASDYLIQQFIENVGDLRVYVARGKIIGHQLRRSVGRELRANVSVGGIGEQIELPDGLVDNCLSIGCHCGADYMVVDWLVTGDEFVFNEMSSTPAGFTGVPRALRAPIARAVLDLARAKAGQLPSTSRCRPECDHMKIMGFGTG